MLCYTLTASVQGRRDNEVKKLCSHCKEEKDTKLFHYHNKEKEILQSWCKSCSRKSAAAHQRLKRMGLTREDYDRMYAEQKGCCAICGQHEDQFEKALTADHDHRTGKIRGLLCMNCNLILGHADDSVDILQKCIAYLIT